jgi:hypothetical protein
MGRGTTTTYLTQTEEWKASMRGRSRCSDGCSDAQMPRSAGVPRLDNVSRSQTGEQVDEDRLKNRLECLRAASGCLILRVPGC